MTDGQKSLLAGQVIAVLLVPAIMSQAIAGNWDAFVGCVGWFGMQLFSLHVQKRLYAIYEILEIDEEESNDGI